MQKISSIAVPSPKELVPLPAQRPPAKPWVRAAKPLGFSILIFAVTLSAVYLLGIGEAPSHLAMAVCGFGFGLSALLAVWAAARGLAALFSAPAASLEIYTVLGTLALGLVSLLMVALGAFAALASTFGFSRGRQLRRHGRVLLPPVHSGGAWSTSAPALENALALQPMVSDSTSAVPAAVAGQWRENGRTEHASVASFARLTLDLMGLGAPPLLVAAANQDALDEIRHTEACFSLAQAIDGRAESPGPFPEAQTAKTLPRARSLALATLAVTSLVDGALHEGVSARVIAKLARRCESPPIAELLKQIAADEGRHAAHGWDVVEWCLQEGGASVADALSGASLVLPLQMRSNLPQAARDGAWERWGIHGLALERDEYTATRAQVLRRVRKLVARRKSGSLRCSGQIAAN